MCYPVPIHMKEVLLIFFQNTAGHEEVWHGHIDIIFSSHHLEDTDEDECIAKFESSLKSDESPTVTTSTSLKRRKMDGMYLNFLKE